MQASPTAGSSSREAAYARVAAIASSPEHPCTQPARATARSGAATPAARYCGTGRNKPPPKTAKLPMHSQRQLQGGAGHSAMPARISCCAPHSHLKFHLFGLFPLEFPLNSQQTPTTLPTRLSNQRATSTCPVLPSSSCWASGNKPLSNQQSTRPSIKINPQPAPLPNKIPRFSFSFPQVFLAPRCTGFKKVCGINAV